MHVLRPPLYYCLNNAPLNSSKNTRFVCEWHKATKMCPQWAWPHLILRCERRCYSHKVGIKKSLTVPVIHNEWHLCCALPCPRHSTEPFMFSNLNEYWSMTYFYPLSLQARPTLQSSTTIPTVPCGRTGPESMVSNSSGPKWIPTLWTALLPTDWASDR